MTPLSGYGGRRFLLTVGSGLVYTGLLIFDKLDSTAYVTLQVATVAVYIGANTVQKVKGAGDG
jgi:hypothetical protein